MHSYSAVKHHCMTLASSLAQLCSALNKLMPKRVTLGLDLLSPCRQRASILQSSWTNVTYIRRHVLVRLLTRLMYGNVLRPWNIAPANCTRLRVFSVSIRSWNGIYRDSTNSSLQDLQEIEFCFAMFTQSKVRQFSPFNSVECEVREDPFALILPVKSAPISKRGCVEFEAKNRLLISQCLSEKCLVSQIKNQLNSREFKWYSLFR